MKRELLATVALVAPLLFVGSVNAGNNRDLQKLLSTGECQKCQLSRVNLSGAHLIGADLRGANLQG
ncbi:MAG: hypothetical protein RLZZ29_1028, partial [Cyanobacteriota bacterium]